MASWPVKFSSYILLLFPKDLVLCALVNVFSPPFPLWSVAASHMFSLSKTSCAACGFVYLIILNKNVNLCNWTILLVYVSSFLQNRLHLCTVTSLYVSCYTPSALTGFFPHGHCRACWIFFIHDCTFNSLTSRLYRWVTVEMPCSLFLKLQAFREKQSLHCKFGHRSEKNLHGSRHYCFYIVVCENSC